jgi:hypothetical protein
MLIQHRRTAENRAKAKAALVTIHLCAAVGLVDITQER